MFETCRAGPLAQHPLLHEHRADGRAVGIFLRQQLERIRPPTHRGELASGERARRRAHPGEARPGWPAERERGYRAGQHLSMWNVQTKGVCNEQAEDLVAEVLA